jgi:hypothetical protein
MVSNAMRDQIRAKIQLLLGDVQYPHGIMADEIDYIVGLQGGYQELAICQAALGHLVAKNADQLMKNYLRTQIDNLAKNLSQQEVSAVNKNHAWSDKYGNLQYVNKGDKIKAVFTGDVPEMVKLPECDKCIDGNMIKPESGSSYKTYPCSCPLGEKWTKTTDFMGPSTVGQVTKKSSTGNVTRTYYNKKFVDNLNKSTIGIAANRGPGVTAMQQAQVNIDPNVGALAQLSQGLGQSVNALLGGLGASGTGSITLPSVPDPPKITVPEEVKGRKFKESL